MEITEKDIRVLLKALDANDSWLRQHENKSGSAWGAARSGVIQSTHNLCERLQKLGVIVDERI